MLSALTQIDARALAHPHPCFAVPPPLPLPQLCSGRSRHIPFCEVMVCVLAVLWWIGCAVTGAWAAAD